MKNINTISRKGGLLSMLRKAASSLCVAGAVFCSAGAFADQQPTDVLPDMRFTAREVTLWTSHWTPSEPHQELIPLVGWFRAVAARNPVWDQTWPEEEYLHP